MKYQKLNDLVRLEQEHIESGARMMRPTSRAEELIADLEAEIVKRDARIAEMKREFLKLASMTASTPLVIEQQRGGALLPDGWALVPIEPTDEMLRSALCYDSIQDPVNPDSRAEELKIDWSLMLSAVTTDLLAQQGKVVGDE